MNEGFATYAEWLWSKHEGGPGPRQIFQGYYQGIPAGSPFWKLRIGDPGPDRLFDEAVYLRGAMTLQRLRERVGDRDFFRILRRWPAVRGGGTGTTPQFVHLAERISGEQLDALFHTWLDTARKPQLPHAAGGRPAARLSDPAGSTLHRVIARGR